MAFKKKLYQLNPARQVHELVVQYSKREKFHARVTEQSIERNVREILAAGISGSHTGLWLLIPEHLRLGTWDLLKGCFACSAHDTVNARMAMQMVSESALCVNRLRAKDSLCHQGFSVANGLHTLATDESIHLLLDAHSSIEYEGVQTALMQIRQLRQHYSPQRVYALDPHRIKTVSQRMMPCKKKRPQEPATKMLQTFFCVDALNGQPLAFNIGSSGKNCSPASVQLLNSIEEGGFKQGLFVADKEYFTQEIADFFCNHPAFDILMPAPNTKKVSDSLRTLDYRRKWAGYAIAETSFSFDNNPNKIRMLVQRSGEQADKYFYKAFLTTSTDDAVSLLTNIFPQRWTIEEFFNFNGDMGWNRASTLNLNIRYGRQTMALLAQAATHQLKQKLADPYRQWTAAHMAQNVLTNMEGSIKVKDDTIIVTFYRDHEKLNLRKHFEHMTARLESEKINPRIPWLFDLKLDFRFR